jgi:VanZ family protein
VDRRRATRLACVWLVSALILTLAPFTLRATPRAWSGFSRLGGFDLLANVALFVPLGVLAVQAGMRRRSAIALGALLSLAVECAQTHIRLRHPSYHDVLANGLGVVLGACASGPLLHLCRRLYVRPLRWALLLAGGATAFALASHYPQLARFTLLFPFAVAVCGGLVASGLWRPPIAFVLAAGGVAVVCARLWWPLEPLWLATSAAGSALGAWPAERG